MAGAAAGLYAATVVGVHRFAVSRRRARAGGFPTLLRLDWDSLLEGLLPQSAAASTGPLTPPDLQARRRLLIELMTGTPLGDVDRRAREAGLSGGTVEWLRTLAMVGASPEDALERLERAEPTSAAELYLRERLRLVHRTHAFNLELSVFGTKRRLAHALWRFGDRPCLYFVRALASGLVGMNRAAIDDLARAVYFSGQAPFYLRAVVDAPYIPEARPVLAYQCRAALAAVPG